MSLLAFLKPLDLQQYEATFAANDVDLATLRVLTDADLKELGLSLGHRRKLMAAIAAPSVPEPAAEGAAEPTRDASIDPERRQLTVMFCDLVGSAALTEALDPERMEQLLRAYQDACTGEIVRFDGFVERVIGDGVLAYFGFPLASEDAAERAVRAALGIVDAVRLVSSPSAAPLAVRIGIASGLVVTGKTVIRPGLSEHPVTGDAVNLAARLQGLAEPDNVVIAASTRGLVRGLFEMEELGVRRLKGVSLPAKIWRVASRRSAPTRFEATHAAGSVKLVGRDQEVALLLDRWELAKAGDGQVVLLSGEAGVGKSRICQALCNQVADDPHRAIRYQCSPFHTNSALQPAIAHLEHACGILSGDAPDIRFDKLERLAATLSEEAQAGVPLLAALLSIPAAERWQPLTFSPEQQKERLIEQLSSLLTGEGKNATLFLVEDAHWMDPTTRELLGLCIDRAASSRCLILVTFRPDFKPEWGGRAEVTALALNRIGRRQSAQLVAEVAGGKKLPAEVLAQIVAKTDGVPLFVEELTKAVLESGLLRENGERFVLNGPLPPLAIPATLHDSLLARLDRLGSAKELAQIGSAIGREFSYEIAAALSPLSESACDEGLRQLVASQLVHQRGVPPRATYVFKHALVQEAAYGTILLSRRQQLHAECAHVLQERFPEYPREKPEVLAHHYTEAGLAEQAVDLWLAAGQRAVERSANLEAIGHLTNGLQVLRARPAGEERDRRELLLQNGLGLPMMACRGYAAPETGEAFGRARELAERLGDRRQRILAICGLWAYKCSLGENRAGEELATILLQLAREARDPGIEMIARRTRGISRCLLGDQSRGRMDLEAALEAYSPSAHRHLTNHFGVDHRVASLAILSMADWVEGYPDRALRTAASALEAAREIEHAHSLGFALTYSACPIAVLRGEWEEAERLAAALLDHARDHRLRLWHAHALAYRAEVLAVRGEFAQSIADFRDALARFKEVVSGARVPIHQGAFALVLSRTGQSHEALAVAEDALLQAEQREEHWCIPELLRVKGEVLLARGNNDEAELAIGQGFEISQRQKMRGWALRTALSLGTLWRNTGRAAAAFSLISEALSPFTEGGETADIIRARELLAAR
jgi:class 3 adenylate cyclase/tetratricopeptide (TPR) repeat protein